MKSLIANIELPATAGKDADECLKKNPKVWFKVIKKARKNLSTILIAFDQDEAGKEATMRVPALVEKADRWWRGMWRFYKQEWIKKGIRDKTGKILRFKRNDRWWKKYDEKIWDLSFCPRDERAIRKEALQSFYNDPDAIKMLERKIKANKRRPKVMAKIRRGLYSISPIMAKWQAKQPKIDIEALKEIPIGELMPDPPKRKYGNKETFLCPLHTEKTPSFQWDKKKNRWYCFGACGKGGSSIDLYMALNNCDFKTAIRAMK